MKPIGVIFTCGIIFGGALAELIDKLGGPVVVIEIPLWGDILICIIAFLVAFWAAWRMDENSYSSR